MKSGPWYSGTAIETAKENIYFLPDWEFVVVEDKALIALSQADPAGRWNWPATRFASGTIDFSARYSVIDFHPCRVARGIWPYDRPAT